MPIYGHALSSGREPGCAVGIVFRAGTHVPGTIIFPLLRAGLVFLRGEGLLASFLLIYCERKAT
jgi:hypothetical protein